MGAVSTLIHDIRSDIQVYCPPETLRDFDRSLMEIGKWEDEMWDTYSISPLSRKFWARPYTVFGAASWFLGGITFSLICAVALAIMSN